VESVGAGARLKGEPSAVPVTASGPVGERRDHPSAAASGKRAALGRALLVDAPLLVLDDAPGERGNNNTPPRSLQPICDNTPTARLLNESAHPALGSGGLL